MKQYITIDIGGTMIKYGIIDENGNILEANEIETEAFKGGSHIFDKVKNICNGYISQKSISGICISTAGMVNADTGAIIYANSSIPNYTGINYKKSFEEIFNIPCEVENDVNCAGICENYVGASKNTHSSLCLTIGTGIGGCIIINNTVINGFSNSGCEIGYMNMLGDTFQNLASTTSLIKNTAKVLGATPNSINGKVIFDKAKQGNKVCIEQIDTLCDYLGYGIANICYVINPEVVVLGGGIMAQKDYLYDKIVNSLSKYLIEPIFKNTKLIFAHHKNNAGMIGAYYNFLNRQNKNTNK
ncbi:ROK family protein [[Clostridium] colinum]|uniref:ROK family protein n=1 Tax=[Clostridium] colinum TaxID=36835 RepID=UPI002FE6D51D